MANSNVLGDWTEQYAGSKVDLSALELTFEDNFDTMSVVPNKGQGDWYSPVRPTYGSATFVGPSGAVSPFSADDGALTIRMEQVNGRWQSGHIQTVNAANQGFSQNYGYFEMRASFEGGAGAWPAFWLLPADPTKPRVEIDIVEAYGADGDGHHAAVHFTPSTGGDLAQAVANSEYSGLKSSMFDGQFHTYGGMVTPDWIVIYFDGVELERFPANKYVDIPLFMNVSLAMNAEDAGKASGVYSMTVDYVRAYTEGNAVPLHQSEGVQDGSDGADSILAGAGADNIRGLNGDDQVDGGAGADTVNGNAGADTMSGGDGADIVYGGRDNDLVDGGAGDDLVVNGNMGADTVHGGAGSDTVYGGKDNDSVYGDAGDDRISGDVGDDNLFGGAGADRFAFAATFGHDRVGDFNYAEGDRVLLAPGTAYTVSVQQGDTVLDLGGGDVLTLTGVSGFGADWVVFG